MVVEVWCKSPAQWHSDRPEMWSDWWKESSLIIRFGLNVRGVTSEWSITDLVSSENDWLEVVPYFCIVTLHANNVTWTRFLCFFTQSSQTIGPLVFFFLVGDGPGKVTPDSQTDWSQWTIKAWTAFWNQSPKKILTSISVRAAHHQTMFY